MNFTLVIFNAKYNSVHSKVFEIKNSCIFIQKYISLNMLKNLTIRKFDF